MAANPWEEFARFSRDMLEQQSAAAQQWLNGRTDFADAMRSAVPGLDPTANTEAMAELWRSWMGLASAMSQAAPGMAGNPNGSGQVAGETINKLLDPASLLLSGGSQVGETIRRLAEGPRFADMGATERRAAKLTRLWLAMQAATRGYEAVVAEAWANATQTFVAKMEEMQRSGGAPEKASDALRLWIDTANDQLLQTHRSPRFLQAQTELLRTGMDFLLAEREVIEALVEPAGLPTRSEMDDVHRTVHDLKQRLRALERSIAASALAEAPSVPSVPPTTLPSEVPADPAGPAKSLRPRRAAPAENAKKPAQPAGRTPRRKQGAKS